MSTRQRARLLTGAAFFLLAVSACGDDHDVETFTTPEVIRSQNGELRTTFTVAEANVAVAGKNLRTTVYNGSFMPPLLRVKPGDTIYLNLNNQTGKPTNEHYHGLNVSPRINDDATVSDNILIRAEPGTQVNYKISIPANHNPGLYWYHAHLHGLAEQQVMGGLSGGLIVEGVLDPFPQLQGIRERVFLLKDTQITSAGTLPDDIDPGGATNRTINGQTKPVLFLDQNELQFWRFANIGADMYYRLKIDGVVFQELARDGNRHNQLVEMSEILLPPGSRSEVLVRGGAPGNYALRTLEVSTGPDGDDYTAAELATIVTHSSQTSGPPLPTSLPAVEDYRTLPVAQQRTITFSDGPDNVFFMDSGAGAKPFDPNVVDATITSGTVEEWTILNTSAELHAFHIHQTDFQVTEINGVPQPFTGHIDNLNVPFQADDSSPPGEAKILIDFRDPNIVGKFVYHCHILEHEDGGMMSIAEVVPAAPVMLSSAVSLPPVRQSASTVDPAVVSNTLAAFQSGSFCRTDRAPEAPSAKAFRIERLQVNAQSR